MIQEVKNIVFVVCHPDDEIIWCGGLIHYLASNSNFNVYVVCLSGNDPNSPRVNEFYTAMKLANVKNCVLLGGELRNLLKELPYTPNTLKLGLDKLNLNFSEIDLIISHSPYGDEHLSPHHRQACRELYYWTKENKIPFSYFSLIPFPFFKYRSLILSFKRDNNFYILNSFKVHINIFKKIFFILTEGRYMVPSYYSQFLIDGNVKSKLIECYPSINLEMHKTGYAMFDSNCESLFFIDFRAYNVLHHCLNRISSPGPENLFLEYSDFRVLLSKIYRKYIVNGR